MAWNRQLQLAESFLTPRWGTWAVHAMGATQKAVLMVPGVAVMLGKPFFPSKAFLGPGCPWIWDSPTFTLQQFCCTAWVRGITFESVFFSPKMCCWEGKLKSCRAPVSKSEAAFSTSCYPMAALWLFNGLQGLFLA